MSLSTLHIICYVMTSVNWKMYKLIFLNKEESNHITHYFTFGGLLKDSYSTVNVQRIL